MASQNLSIEQEIVEMVKKRYEELRKMSREELASVYMQYIGQEAHPRIELDIMAKACARFYQNELWSDRVGHMPDYLIERDMQFWLSNAIFFVRKEDLKQEKAKLIEAKASPFSPRQTGATGSKAIKVGAHPKKMLNIYESNVRATDKSIDVSDKMLAEVMEWLKDKKQGGEVPYDAMVKFAKKKRYPMQVNMIIMLLQKQGAVEIVDPNPTQTTEDVQDTVAPVNDDNGEVKDDSVCFDDVLCELTKSGANERTINPDAVDFHGDGTTERFI